MNPSALQNKPRGDGDLVSILTMMRPPSSKAALLFAGRTRNDACKPANEQKAEIEAAGEKPIFSYNQTDFVKDRVAIEVQFGKYSFVAYDLFVKHLAFYVRDQIDVGIEILAMKSLQSNMSSGPGYYEGELYNIIRNGRGVPAVPLIIIGVEP
jgi:hypothetical protein